MELLDRVRSTIRRYDLAGPRTRLVVALSGGSDSVALAHLLRLLDAQGELSVTGLAHFNHQLRPAASTDERFCERMAASMGRPLLVDREEIAERARRERRSIEDAGRTARYEFFERARLHFDADVVAVGHTRDDQAETFLLRLLRGAGTRGLASIHPRRDAIIRPLLACRRTELRAHLDSHRIAYVHDDSNEDVTVPRNRIRSELLPFLEDRFNPGIVDVLSDEAEIAREAWQWMDEEAAALSGRICRQEDGVCRIDAEALDQLPLALARLVVHEAMMAMAGGRPVSFAHVESVLRLVRIGTGIDAPGQRVERAGPHIVLRSKPANHANLVTNLFRYSLSIPGEVALAEAGCLVTAEEAASVQTDRGAIPGTGNVAVVRRDRCPGPLAVRNRRPGDRFRPLGLDGLKKLQDFFVDRKVARERRDAIPLVVDESDRIVWVAGYSIDDEFRVTDPAQAVLILRLKVLGGPA